MGSMVNQSTAMVIARATFVVAFANTFAAVCLSDFGAMFLLLASRSDVVGARFKEHPKESL
jgi:hypothetical protein